LGSVKLFNWARLGIADWFARGAAEEGSNIALGVSEHLDEFAKSINATTWKVWASKDFESQFIETITNSATKIHFNLDGIGAENAWRSFGRCTRIGKKLSHKLGAISNIF